MRRATGAKSKDLYGEHISIHALHEESDAFLVGKTAGLHLFQSTLSMRRATAFLMPQLVGVGISIHALHEESDEY